MQNYEPRNGDIIRLRDKLFSVAGYNSRTDKIKLIPVQTKGGGREYFSAGAPRWFNRPVIQEEATFVESFEYGNRQD